MNALKAIYDGIYMDCIAQTVMTEKIQIIDKELF